MIRVRWGERTVKGSVPYFEGSLFKTREPEVKEHTYRTLKGIYKHVEDAWEQGYVPRVIYVGDKEYTVCIAQRPMYIGSVFIALRATVSGIEGE